MLLLELVDASNAVSQTAARTEKTSLLARLLTRLTPQEAPVAVSYLAGRPRQSPLGVGHAAVFAVDPEPAPGPTLQILAVDDILQEVSETSGPGSKRQKHDLLTTLLSRATATEQEFLRGLMLRNLRQGALEAVMADAVAKALDVPPQRVRRAAMLEGDLVSVAARALSTGPSALDAATLRLFQPVQPMLAKTAETVTEAITQIGSAIVEQKLDGLRLQVHKQGSRVTVYTRNLRDVTSGMGAVVSAVRDFEAEALILDGEGLLIGPEGIPMSFQDSMRGRFGSGDEEFTAFFFDIIHAGGEDLIDLPLTERRRWLSEVVPTGDVVESIETGDPAEAERFFSKSVEDGFEGVVVKDPTSPYAAGRRGSGWMKVKPTHTLDLVVLAAEWGSGRRQGWLSNLHLGARSADGTLVMLGKTFKGLTDEMLAWQTSRFLEIEERRQGHVVYLKPEIVYEIAFDGVQRSTRYPGGVALRFARVKGYRDDKSPDDADTIETVRTFL